MQRLGMVLYLLGLGFAIVMLFPLASALLYSVFGGFEPAMWGDFIAGSLFYLALALLAWGVGTGARRYLAGY